MFKFFIFFNLINLYIFGCCCNENNNKNNNIGNIKNSYDKDKKDVKNVILLTTGALNPVHKGHINSLKLAQDYLEKYIYHHHQIYI